MGLFFSESQAIKNAQRARTHSDSTVVGDIRRTDRDNVSDTSVLPSCPTNYMASSPLTIITASIVSESKEWSVDHVMIRDDLSAGCDQIFGASCTQCGLDGFHPINPHNLQLFSRMVLNITFRVQLVTPNRKWGKYLAALLHERQG